MRYLRELVVGAVLAFGAVSVGSIQGCTGTQAAYRAAESRPDAVAYVVIEQYAAVLHEAVLISQKPTTPGSAIAAIQRADVAIRPAIDKLRGLAEAYQVTQTAETEAELQAAINRTILLLNDLIQAVKAARG